MNSVSGHNGITGMVLILWSQTTGKLNKIYEAVVFIHQTKGSTRQWSLREGNQMRWSTRTPAHCLEQVPRAQDEEREPKQNLWSSWIEKAEAIIWDIVPKRGRSYKERGLLFCIWRWILLNLLLTTNLCMMWETYPKPREEPPGMSEL